MTTFKTLDQSSVLTTNPLILVMTHYAVYPAGALEFLSFQFRSPSLISSQNCGLCHFFQISKFLDFCVSNFVHFSGFLSFFLLQISKFFVFCVSKLKIADGQSHPPWYSCTRLSKFSDAKEQKKWTEKVAFTVDWDSYDNKSFSFLNSLSFDVSRVTPTLDKYLVFVTFSRFQVSRFPTSWLCHFFQVSEFPSLWTSNFSWFSNFWVSRSLSFWLCHCFWVSEWHPPALTLASSHVPCDEANWSVLLTLKFLNLVQKYKV